MEFVRFAEYTTNNKMNMSTNSSMYMPKRELNNHSSIRTSIQVNPSNIQINKKECPVGIVIDDNKINNKSTICLFDNDESPLCMDSRAYELLRKRLIERFQLNYVPDMSELKRLLKVSDYRIQIENRLRDFLADDNDHMEPGEDRISILKEYRVTVPNIENNGLSGYNVLQILEFLKKFHPKFHYRGPCLLDYSNSFRYNYSNFSLYPIFKDNNNNIDCNIYYLLLLTIESTQRKPGHWIGICVVENCILYYDSLNKEIEPRFLSLLKLISIELKSKYGNIVTWRNNKQVQFSGKYCGVFQIHFITTILELYKQNELYNKYSNSSVTTLNTSKLNHYLQDNLTQDIIERVIAYFFYKCSF